MDKHNCTEPGHQCSHHMPASYPEDDASRNENLAGGKSQDAHIEEAKQEQKLSDQKRPQKSDRQPDEIKSTGAILPEDAHRKADSADKQ